MDSLFEKYVKLIRKRAHDYSKKWKIQYSEMESQGFLIFCECLEKFDVTKASFCTYLYIQLNRLNDYGKTYRRQQGLSIQEYFNPDSQVEDYEEVMVSTNYDLPSMQELLFLAEQELSSEAYKILVWILSREWERKGRRKPTIAMAIKFFNQPRVIVEEFWNELKSFWLNQGVMLYV